MVSCRFPLNQSIESLNIPHFLPSSRGHGATKTKQTGGASSAAAVTWANAGVVMEKRAINGVLRFPKMRVPSGNLT